MALSNFDIAAILDKLDIPYRIIRYEELANIQPQDIPKTNWILYFGYPGDLGHWTLIYTKGKTVHFYDPYGIHPDGQWNKIYNTFNRDPPEHYLSKLLHELRNMGYHTSYNHYDLQNYLIHHSIGKLEKKLSENECGEIVILRLLFKELNDKEFFEFAKNLHPDEIVKFII
ncbi:MAG: hypothetical protein NZZ41_07515 [Candidatus Dojkabacteria bacterium]|nr:hypothetical protein [Candidatus Dojkabacteria bacterium]